MPQYFREWDYIVCKRFNPKWKPSCYFWATFYQSIFAKVKQLPQNWNWISPSKIDELGEKYRFFKTYMFASMGERFKNLSPLIMKSIRDSMNCMNYVHTWCSNLYIIHWPVQRKCVMAVMLIPMLYLVQRCELQQSLNGPLWQYYHRKHRTWKYQLS